jgi:hypothetical protein
MQAVEGSLPSSHEAVGANDQQRLFHHLPGMYATTLFPLLSWTFATLRLALLGFLGAMVDTWGQTQH